MLCSPAVPLGYACKQRLALQEASAGKRELRRAGCRGCGRGADDEEEVAPQRSARAMPPPAARLGAFAPPRRSAGLSPGSGSSRRAGGGGRRPAGAGRGTGEAEPALPGPAILAPGSGGRGLRGLSVRAAFPGQGSQAGSPHSCAPGQPLSGTCWRWERKWNSGIRGVSEMRLRLVVPGLPWGVRAARSRFFSSSKTILSNQK
ncbi:protein SOGA3-like [Rissa tridactyla]|uniref:protein SOGA3-like n=1 Tax=Rissa tridactyla TaxID=75485 RepID=UPI0023BAB8E4|nr:protein SOGA3-like [Rissa tridactyla]